MQKLVQKALRYLKAKGKSLDEVEFVVLDLELTGLDPKAHEIVSAAWVTMHSDRIQLKSARHIINSDVKQLDQSPVYHGIDEQTLNEGISLEALMTELCNVLHGKVLVCHNAYLDWGFIRLNCKALGLEALPLAIVDTMQIEKRRQLKQNTELHQDSLTLTNCRTRYQLPDYEVHNALTDALATAELLLVLINKIGAGKPLKLSALM
ncbi:exonuclease domain-containing protein [Pseudoalteromonas phenolica]|uniref:exonuclease domain-containing protein n=1 Tax=Pseudoalteromonas phenolica TaxID=161398 RepID=UPI00110B692A|nr:exonuclease domain-containing protein [Pseudoalteromonas phenolica]TMO55105.1 3'-5' exonuclease [Pseudoalteromonas phenolica]